MNMNCKPAFKYELKNMLIGCAQFFAVIVGIVIASFILANRFDGRISFSGFGFTGAICLFVFGIVEPRPCLRLCSRMGVSRRTAFLCNVAAAIVASLLLAIGGEAVLAIGKAAGNSNVYLSDLYELIYIGSAQTFLQHVGGALFNTLLMLFAYCGGMFFTYLFWRLNKGWTIVAALSIPVLLNLVPLLIYKNAGVARAMNGLLSWILASAGNLMLCFVLLSAVLCAVCWLMVRRANIKAPSGK